MTHKILLWLKNDDDEEDEEDNVHVNTSCSDLTLPRDLSNPISVEIHATSGSGLANNSSTSFPTTMPIKSLSNFSTFGTISKPPPKNLTNQLV